MTPAQKMGHNKVKTDYKILLNLMRNSLIAESLTGILKLCSILMITFGTVNL